MYYMKTKFVTKDFSSFRLFWNENTEKITEVAEKIIIQTNLKNYAKLDNHLKTVN